MTGDRTAALLLTLAADLLRRRENRRMPLYFLWVHIGPQGSVFVVNE